MAVANRRLKGADGNFFAMADTLRAMRRHRDRKGLGPGAMRLIVQVLIISTPIYGNIQIQGQGEARPPGLGLCHTALRTPPRRSVMRTAGGSEFAALTLGAVTGGSTHHLPRERFDAHYGNTENPLHSLRYFNICRQTKAVPDSTNGALLRLTAVQTPPN